MNSTLNKELIKVGTRGSRLALLQVDEIQSLLEENVGNADLRSLPSFECIIHKTAGDQDKKTPLTQNLADDFFTDTLDRALLNHKIDIAIHSAKDLPEQLAEGLSIFALTASLDDTDAFVGMI
jgi:porphobilinogen deaminase